MSDDLTTPPWWAEGGTERCPHCDRLYAYEIEVRCADCDAPSCPFCAVTVRRTEVLLVCPDCTDCAESTGSAGRGGE